MPDEGIGTGGSTPREMPEHAFRQSTEFKALQRTHAEVREQRRREWDKWLRRHCAALGETFADLPLYLMTPPGMALGIAAIGSVLLVLWSMP